MQFEKKSVRLGDIRPSEQNPREDFGDIGALARSIEATGGELVLIAALGANPHGHADSVQTTDLDARREIRDMAAELGVDADI